MDGYTHGAWGGGSAFWYRSVPSRGASVVPCGTKVKGLIMARKPAADRPKTGEDGTTVRQRILEAAFAAFMKDGYAATSTLAIATRARVSKPEPRDRDGFAQLLTSFGAQLLREVTEPTVVGVFRLAIAEASRAPEVAMVLDSVGRGASRAALRKIMTHASASGLVDGHPAELSQQFATLLFGDVMMGLLLQTTKRPTQEEAEARARSAAAVLLQLHPQRG